MDFIINQILNPFNIAVVFLGFVISVIIWLYSNKKKSRQLRNYVPNIWTSLGILGTFAAIVYTLGGSNNDWTDINRLVTDIVPAFVTSIIGISGAIVTSILTKMKSANEDFRIESDYLEKFRLTPEEHVGAIDRHMVKLLSTTKEQHRELMKESELQRSVAEKMITEFTTNLRDFYDKLYVEEKLHMEQMTEQYLSGLNQIILSTHGTIKEKFESLFDQHAESLKGLMTSEIMSLGNLTSNVTASLNANSQKIIKSISDIGINEIDAINAVVENQKLQLETIVNENKIYLGQIVKDNGESLKNVMAQTVKDLNSTAEEFTGLIKTLRSLFENLVNGIPADLKHLEEQIIETIKRMGDEKFEVLSNNHANHIKSLMQKVSEFERQVSQSSMESQTNWCNSVNAELTKMLDHVDVNVKSHVTLMKDMAAGLTGDLATIQNSLMLATSAYTDITMQLTSLVKALQKETNATEVYANGITSTNTQLALIQKLLTDIANKNLQLRQELSQWTRTHKHIKVDVANGTKECPNCKSENPIDASYCKKCATSFWECRPIESREKET